MADNTRENVKKAIFDAIINLKDVKHQKPTEERIWNFIKKTDDKQEVVNFELNLEKMATENLLITKGSGKNKAYIIVSPKEVSNTTSNEEVEDDWYTQETMLDSTTQQQQQKQQQLSQIPTQHQHESEQHQQHQQQQKQQHQQTSYLYEQIIGNLKSEVLFLREQLRSKESHFLDEIKHLKNQVNFLSTKTVVLENTCTLSCNDKFNVQDNELTNISNFINSQKKHTNSY